MTVNRKSSRSSAPWRITGLLMGILLMCNIPTASAWLGTYNNRQPLAIVENTHATVPNFEMNVSINTTLLNVSGKLKGDCTDLAFGDASDNRLYYWNETPCYMNGSNTTYSINTTLTAGTTTIYMYYNDPTATEDGYRNASLVYALWEDFENYADTTALETVWDEADTGDVTLETSTVYGGSQGLKVAGGEFGTGGRDFGADVLSEWQDGIIYQFAGRTTVVADNFYIRLYNTPGGTDFNNPGLMYIGYPSSGKLNFGAELAHTISTNTWYIWRFTMNSSNSNYTTLSFSGTDSGNSHNIANIGQALGVSYSIRDPGDVNYIDDIVVRKNLVPWPTYSFGAEEQHAGVELTSPTNTTYNTLNVSMEWQNYSVDYDSVWYSLDGAANTSLTGNLTLEFDTSGNHHLELYMNDSTPTLYSDTVDFTVDLIVSINITDPNEGSTQTPPTLALTFDYVSALDCNASLYSWNGSANVSTGCSNTSINIEGLGGNYTIYLYVNNSDGKADSDSVNITIANPLINCTEAGAIVAVNFTFADEETLASLYGSAEYAVTVTSGSYEYTYNLSVENVTDFAICTHDPPWQADMILQYDSGGYSTRWYFFDNATLSSTTSDITLYLLNTSSGSTVDVDVQNPYGYPLPDVYVKFQKYYISEDLYRTVAMMKSDDQAEGQAFLDITDAWYKYVVTQNGVVLRTVGPSLLAADSLVISTATGSTYTWEDYSDGIATSCEYDDTLVYVICEIDDPSGLATEMCLRVDQYNVMNMTLFNETCGSSTSMTLMVNVSEAASYNNSIRYMLIASTSSGDRILESDTVALGASVLYGLMGVFLTAMIYMVAAGAGYWNPAASIVLAALGIVVSVIVGFFVVELSAVGSLLLVFGIFMYKVKT